MRNKILVMLSIFCAAVRVHAISMQVNGFGSGRFGQSLNEDVVKDGLSASRGNFGEDSLIGLNIGSSISDRIEVAAQVVAGGSDSSTGSLGSSSWDVNANWAFISYKLLDNLKLKYGRQLLPNWLVAEYDKVAYLQPYRRIPEAMRRISYFHNFNGLLAEYVIPFEKGNVTISTWAGDYDIDVESGTRIKAKASNLYGGALTLNYKSFKLHSQLSIYDTDIISNSTSANLASINKTKQYNFGLAYEENDILLWSEYGRIYNDNSTSFGATGNLFEEGEAFYVLAGYRIGKFMPRVTYSKANTIRFGYPGVEGKEQVVNLGVNYNLHPKAVLKLDFEVAYLEDEFNGVTYRRSANSTEDSGSSILASIDFIF